MSDPVEATLFELSAKDDAAAPAVDEAPTAVPGPVLLVTNRYNLLEFLSAGLVLPQPAISKYYVDLLQLAPGRLPLVRGPVHSTIVEQVSSEDPTAFAVALEVDPALLGDSTVPARAATAGRSALSAEEADIWAPAGVLPLGAICAIHFRSQEELDEHTAREYENIESSIPLEVSPGLFEGGSVSLDELGAFLAELDDVSSDLGDRLELSDRVTGAHCLMLFAAPADLATLRQLVRFVVGKPAPKSQAQKGAVPGWLSPELLSGRATSAGGVDAALFGACCSVLRAIDRQAAWRALDVLNRVEKAVEEYELAPEDLEEIKRNLRPIASILRNERDFKPFEHGAGLDAAKAFLMVLLRPEPGRLFSWNVNESGADESVTILAAALVGLLRGHKKLSTEYRNVALDRFLAERVAVQTAATVPDAVKPMVAGEIVVEAAPPSESSEAERAIVRLGSQVLVEKLVPTPGLLETLKGADLQDGSVRLIAIDLCREMGWTDCVQSVVRAAGGEILPEAKGKFVTFRFPGLIDVEYVLDAKRFRSALDSNPAISPEIEATFLIRLKAAPAK
jgi:hypothetical protein